MNLRQQLIQAQNECKRLSKENAKLKNELEQYLSDELVELTPNTVTNDSSRFDKIQLFRDLFKGRIDIYAQRWEAKNGKTGYAPACANEWRKGICKKPVIKCSECQQRKLIPFSDQIIYDHLTGKYTVGLYPLLTNNACWLLVVDFDKEKWNEDVLAFAEVCKSFNVPFSIERSRSGNGAHVWIFFDEEIPASLARELGKFLLEKTIASRFEVGLDSYDRLFPSQDRLTGVGFGNLIALPLQQGPRLLGNSVFIDMDLMEYRDQWHYLSTIQKMKRSKVESILEPLINEKKSERLTVTSPLKLILKNGIHILTNEIPPELLLKLSNLASLGNPEFYKARARRMSTHHIPKMIDCSYNDAMYFIMPRGCENSVKELIETYNVNIKIENERFEGTQINVNFHGTLTPQQQDALQSLLEYQDGILSATTGFGKTVIGAALIARRRINTLIIVHRTQLMAQWIEQLSVFLGIPKESIGQIGGGKKTATGIIDVATIQSLNSKGQINSAVTRYGQIIVDECHHLAAFSFEQVMKSVQAKYVHGLTATFTRKDGLHPIIAMQCGPIRYKTDMKTQAKIRPFLHRLVERSTEFTSKETSIQKIYSDLVNDEERNRLVFNDVLLAMEEGRTPLILTERIAHVEVLQQLFEGFVKNVIVLTGDLKKKERTQSFDKLRDLSDQEELLIIATGKYIGEGFDYARLDTLFLVMPISWKGVLQQYVGRLHRNYTDKQEVRVYDYVDLNMAVLKSMHSKRMKGFQSMGYQNGTGTNENSEQMKLF